jgi:hypothetical protein
MVIPGPSETRSPESITTGEASQVSIVIKSRLWLWIPGSAFQAAPG